MPFSLRFMVEDRGGIMVLIDYNSGIVRPATSTEVELWNALTKRVAPARESYVRVNEQDMLLLLAERDRLREQVETLQERCNTLMKEHMSKVLEELEGSDPPE